MHRYLFPALEKSPVVLRRLLAQVPPDALDRPTHPGRFTPREVVCHLSDWEAINLHRLLTGFIGPGDSALDIDEGIRAAEQRYRDKDPAAEAALLESRRALTVGWFRELTPADWEKTFVHTRRGVTTLYDHANLIIAHDVYHIHQLSDVVHGYS
jgi:hypothetical protein